MTAESVTAFPGGIAVCRRRSVVLLLLLLSSALGCRRQGPITAQTTSPTKPERSAREFSLPGTVVTPSEALAADEFFDRGMRRLQRRLYAGAATDLEAAAQALAEPSRATLAWYSAGIARDEAGEFAIAADDLARAITLRDGSVISRDAHTRLTRLLVYLERWTQAGQVARSTTTQFGSLNAIESIVVKGALALSALASHDLDAAAREIEAARSIIEERQYDVPAHIQRDVAVVYFALGELRRLRSNKIVFVPLPADFNVQLERRCQLLLEAQAAYSMAMRAYDAHWSVMAGFRVGELYEDLHRDLMALLTWLQWPDAESQKLYEAAFRLRYSILLDKASTGLDQTLQLATRTDDKSKWVQWALDARNKLHHAVASEREALANVPFTRDELLRALEHLQQVRGNRPSKSPGNSRAQRR